jgi:hypothetical protein
MDDRIISSYINSFKSEYNLGEFKESDVFEHFINYCIISKSCAESFNLDDVSTGGGGDNAIDGLGIIINGHLVSSTHEINDLTKMLGRIEVEFLFIQSKTSSKFDMGDIGNFLFGVKSFFADEPMTVMNERIVAMRELQKHVYKKSLDFIKNPVCRLYYATTGEWNDDAMLRARIDSDINILKNSKIFSDVVFTPVDADYIQKAYRELKNKVVKEVIFEKHTILPIIDGVQQAFIGILPCTEYLKLITNDDNTLRRSLFFDNVRDFQGNNPVNSEIADTIKDNEHQDNFVLLNNGVTIVAKTVSQTGIKFSLRDYQIVNGCQTSNIIYNNKDLVKTNTYLPIKLIVTDNLEVTNKIIKATNRQTEVKIEAFEALSPFHKKLEEYYSAMDVKYRLCYERRSKQYEHDQSVIKDRIVTIAAQIKSILAMFLEEPHSTHRYYGELLKAYKKKLFQADHRVEPYYISSYATYLLDTHFKKNIIKNKHRYRELKYHIILIFRILACGSDVPNFSSNNMKKYCDKLINILYDEIKTLDLFNKSLIIIDQCIEKYQYDNKELHRRKEFTFEIIKSASAFVQQAETNSNTTNTNKKANVISREEVLEHLRYLESANKEFIGLKYFTTKYLGSKGNNVKQMYDIITKLNEEGLVTIYEVMREDRVIKAVKSKILND